MNVNGYAPYSAPKLARCLRFFRLKVAKVFSPITSA